MGYPQGIFERLDWLTKKYKQLCCLIQGGASAGCITHKDITWDELNAKNSTGTLQDCFYNVIDRPASGTDPLYVLAEGGRVDLDNEVVRTQPSTGSLCVDSLQKGLGCFNIYAQQSIYTVEYVPGVQVIEMRLDPKACIEGYINIGDIVTQIDPLPGGAIGTVLWIDSFEGGRGCFAYVQVTSGTFNPNGILSNGTYDIKYDYGDKCGDASPLTVGTEVIGVPSNSPWPQPSSPTGTITAISGSTITITPTSGSWDGIVVFVVRDKDKETICFYTLTAPIVSVSTQLNSETICWDAESYLGSRVYLNTLMQASDGLMYGTLEYPYFGFDCNRILVKEPVGQLFSLDPVTNKVTVLFEFNDAIAYGGFPSSGLIEIAGELYGTCNSGGIGGLFNGGTIWKWNIATKTFTKLYDIDNGNDEGSFPYGSLLNIGGVLYGTCENGGANGAGTIWSFDTATDTFTKLADFDDTEYIRYPQGPLVEVNPGELWGTSYNGGVNDQGTIFKYTISSGLLEIVINLNDVSSSANGASGGVHLGSDGNVYFNTQSGGYANGGVICQIIDVATSPTVNILHEFDYSGEGGYGDAVCPIYIAGNLYGVTIERGGYNSGTIYKLNVDSGFYQVLHDFNPTTDGAYAYVGQLFQIGNELFGMTNPGNCKGGAEEWEQAGGPIPKAPINCSCGQIFKYNIDTDVYTNIHALNAKAQTSANIATDICASITNPDYVCHTVGNCIYIDGPAGENGYTLALKTVVTYRWCRTIDPLDPTACDPTVGDTLFDNTNGQVIGTIQTVTITEVIPGEKVCGTLIVELADNKYFPQDIDYTINETGCIGHLFEVTGSTLSYVVTPFAGGTEPVNLPCYYNVPFDVITEYPLSQKLTRKEIEYLVANNLLIPGTYYRIIDVDFFLYGGTEIVIQAVAPDKFNDVGMGKFYVPKYDKEQPGYGVWHNGYGYSAGQTAIWGGFVWTNLQDSVGFDPNEYTLNYSDWSIPGRVKITISGISGVFAVGDYVYGYDSNYMGVITEVGTDYLIVMAPPSFFAYPVWDTSNIIYDNDSGAEATMDSVILHTDYFSDLVYDVRWDEIKYDYANDFISYRKDNAGNTVNQERWEYDDFGASGYRNILGMQWGNEFDPGTYRGVGSTVVSGNGYVELINFKGGYFFNNLFKESSFYLNTFIPSYNSRLVHNNLSGASTITNNLFNDNVGFTQNVLEEAAYIYGNSFTNCYFSQNYINSGSIGGNVLNNNSEMSLNKLLIGHIDGNILNFNSRISFNNLNNNSGLVNGNLSNSSAIEYSNFNNGCSFNLASTVLSAQSIRYLNFYAGIMNSNISGATIIYGNYEKDLIQRQDGTVVLRYINNSNTQVITAVTT